MVQPQPQPANDSQLPPASTHPNPPTPRRLTMPTFTASPTYNPRHTMRFGNGQCTHLTMTRLYTTEYRCSICLRIGSMGWVYRCTQDRELLIEEDMERGNEEKLDKLCDIFERPTSPRKRTPAARLHAMSFFGENSDAALESYSPTQLNTIVKQRAHAKELASQADPDLFQTSHTPFPILINPLFPNPDIIAPGTLATPMSTKPWLPLRGGECQFKVCHLCRPTCEIRSYLSLNGIANNDIPPTAITGFGFHLTRKRPVALVKHVKNLGLRESVPPRRSSPRNTMFLIPPAGDSSKNDSSLGLGILTNIELPYRSKPLPALPLTAETSNYPNAPEYSPEVNTASREFALLYPRPRRLGVSLHTEAHMVPLPEQTQEEIAMTGAPLTPMEELELENGVFGRAPLEVSGGVAVMEESVDFRVADVVTQF